MLNFNKKSNWLDLYLQNLTDLFEQDKESLIARYSSNPSNNSNAPTADKGQPLITSSQSLGKNNSSKPPL